MSHKYEEWKLQQQVGMWCEKYSESSRVELSRGSRYQRRQRDDNESARLSWMERLGKDCTILCVVFLNSLLRILLMLLFFHSLKYTLTRRRRSSITCGVCGSTTWKTKCWLFFFFFFFSKDSSGNELKLSINTSPSFDKLKKRRSH